MGQWLSFVPQLEMLLIRFLFPQAVPNRDVEREVMHTPITTHVTLPDLRRFRFQGVSWRVLGRPHSSSHRPSPREVQDWLLHATHILLSRRILEFRNTSGNLISIVPSLTSTATAELAGHFILVLNYWSSSQVLTRRSRFPD
jgi:hypothetical protein